MDPAVYDAEGRGNCNMGAKVQEKRVWCYVNKEEARWCPDARPSDNEKYAMSRIACITPEVKMPERTAYNAAIKRDP